MSELLSHDTPKAPRWISTEAGKWAWVVNEEWRVSANKAMSVSERRHLLDKAEDMHRSLATTTTI
ncbi:MAG: hypothetical protein HGA19_15850 [Oscillochloris sp.]|nr:hypothetical protein [Oscillochloris sp.]